MAAVWGTRDDAAVRSLIEGMSHNELLASVVHTCLLVRKVDDGRVLIFRPRKPAGRMDTARESTSVFNQKALLKS